MTVWIGNPFPALGFWRLYVPGIDFSGAFAAGKPGNSTFVPHVHGGPESNFCRSQRPHSFVVWLLILSNLPQLPADAKGSSYLEMGKHDVVAWVAGESCQMIKMSFMS